MFFIFGIVSKPHLAMKFFDAHFHMWDTVSADAVIDAGLIGPPAAMHPVYTVQVKASEACRDKPKLHRSIDRDPLCNAAGGADRPYVLCFTADLTVQMHPFSQPGLKT